MYLIDYFHKSKEKDFYNDKEIKKPYKILEQWKG